jgi:hypothetical protein
MECQTRSLAGRGLSSECGLGQFHIFDTYDPEQHLHENAKFPREHNLDSIFTSRLQDNLDHHDYSEGRPEDLKLVPTENVMGDQYLIGARPCSPAQKKSPTESQLRAERFEYHNEIPEDVQIDRFGDKAFRKALREVKPDLPRKQQWYAWNKVRQMLENSPQSQGDWQPHTRWRTMYQSLCMETEAMKAVSTQASEPKGYSAESDEVESGSDGDTAACRSEGGQHSHARCPKNKTEQVGEQVRDQAKRAMTTNPTTSIDWYPDLAPSSEVWRAHGEGTPPCCYTANLTSNPTDAPQTNGHWTASTIQEQETTQLSSNLECSSVCGISCQGTGQCNCDAREENRLILAEQHPIARLSEQHFGWLISKIAEEKHDRKVTHPECQPVAQLNEQPYGWLISETVEESNNRNASQSDDCAEAVMANPAMTNAHSSSPGQTKVEDASSLIGPSPGLSLLNPILRPDTRRPIDQSIRQSVEPETPRHLLHRESTPAYDARSPSPSPRSLVSADVEMSEAPPTPQAQTHLHPMSSPDLISPVRTVTAPETPMPPSRVRGSSSRARPKSPAKIPAPQITSQIKPGKRGDKNTRKSTVQGGKVEKPGAKSRNVTQKLTNSVRKVTEKVKESTRVTDAVAKIEATVRKNSEGTPTRRSERIRKQRGA